MLNDPAHIVQNGDFAQRARQAMIHAAIAVASEVVNDVQTITVTGAPTGGTFTVNGGPITGTVALNWNSSAGQAQVAIQTNAGVGNGNVVCSGGPLPGTAITVTYCGTLGNQPQSAMGIGTNSLTGGSTPTPSAAHTTTGVAFVNHSQRATLAKNILTTPDSYTSQFAFAIADNSTIQTTDYPSSNGWNLAVAAATADSDIQFACNSIYNSFLGL